MTVRAELGLSADVPLVICILQGDESPESLNAVSSALKRLEDVHFALIAPGRVPAVTATLRRAVRNDLTRVHAIGAVGDLIDFIRDGDAGLVPEGVQDAYAFAAYTQAGLPIVVPDASPYAVDVGRTKAGVVYSSGRLPELVKALRATTRRRSEFADRIDSDARDATAWVRDAAYPSTLMGRHACRRVGIGPANYASQANEWARALRERLTVDAESFSLPGNSRRLPDRVIAKSASSDFHSSVEEMETVLTRYSHLLVDAFLDVLAGIVADDIGPEIGILRRNGTQLALIAHGSEVRLPQRHADRIAHSYFHDVTQAWFDAQTAQCARNAATAHAFDGPVFVSTPDLLLDLPEATWLPLVIPQPNAWDSPAAFAHSGPLRVLHRPTWSEPPLKGSAVIVPVLERLHAEGLIELIHAPDLVPAEQMPDLIRRTDILVDQIQTGSYGVASVEAMWAGRAVVGWIAPDVRPLLPEAVPIIDAPPRDFEAVLRDIIQRRDDLPAIAEAGQAYAREFHDGRRAAEVLHAFIESPVRI